MSETETLDKYELRNKAMKSAGWQGWRYGMGIAFLALVGFQWASPHDWYWVVPGFVSGAAFPTLGASIFRWMAIIQWNSERNDV